MRSSRLACLLIAAPLLAVPASVSAQQAHVTDRGSLDRAVAERARSAGAQRESIRRLLDRPEVRDVAERYNLDISTVQAGAATLNGTDLERVAAQANAVESALVAGDTITITTTTLIILLLLVIIVILIA
jgi:hypothetical protein